MYSTKRLWTPEARARKHLKLGPNTIPAIMRHGCSILTATISRSFLKAKLIFIVLNGIRYALPPTKPGASVIVNTTSSSVWMGEPEHVAHQTADVRCNLVALGFTRTAAAFMNTNEEYLNQMLALVRSSRIGAPEDIAAMVAFLFSDDAYINGQAILVDGGANLT